MNCSQLSRPVVILGLVLYLALLVTSCAPKLDLENERATLLAADRDFSETSVQMGAPEAFYRFLADSALQLPNGDHPIAGKKAIRDSMLAGPDFMLTWKPEKAEVSLSADLGYTWGTYEVSFETSGGQRKTNYGKYLNVWQKQPDGKWKVAVDMGNTSPSP